MIELVKKYNIAAVFLMATFACMSASAQSVRAERKLITEGNKLFTERKYVEAARKYEEALGVNSSSAVGRYNLGLAQIRQVSNPQDTAPKVKSLLDMARKNLSSVASLAKDKPGLASKANYNLGNLEFNTKEYKNAIEYYKQALRINPDDESARKNLRIAQKQMQNQDKNEQNQNQDQKDKNKEQDKNKNDNQDNNQDKKDNNQDRNKQKEDKKDNGISQQTANQILQAMDNKENQTRVRVNRANKGEKANGSGSSRKKW